MKGKQKTKLGKLDCTARHKDSRVLKDCGTSIAPPWKIFCITRIVCTFFSFFLELMKPVKCENPCDFHFLSSRSTVSKKKLLCHAVQNPVVWFGFVLLLVHFYFWKHRYNLHNLWHQTCRVFEANLFCFQAMEICFFISLWLIPLEVICTSKCMRSALIWNYTRIKGLCQQQQQIKIFLLCWMTLCGIFVAVEAGDLYPLGTESHLISHLMKNYSRHGRPLYNPRNAVNVNVSFKVTSLLGVVSVICLCVLFLLKIAKKTRHD